MNKNFTKILKTGAFSLSILFASFVFTHNAQAINKCAGEAVSISWSSANVSGATCNFERSNSSFQAEVNGNTPATPNTSGTGATFNAPDSNPTTPNTQHSISLSCQKSDGTYTTPVTDTLNIVSEPRCCAIGTAQTEGRTVWNGSACVRPIAPALPTGNINSPTCYISYNKSACNNTVTWDTNHSNSTQVLDRGNVISTANSGSITVNTPHSPETPPVNTPSIEVVLNHVATEWSGSKAARDKWCDICAINDGSVCFSG